jgi:hypothetical protein
LFANKIKGPSVKKDPVLRKSIFGRGIMSMSAGGSADMLIETEKTMKVIAKDANGIPRAWGEGSTTDAAMSEAKDAATEYLKRRPDTGPASAWTFELD